MKIDKIEIENFRSIKHLELNITEISGRKCFIFLGVNESGKSNILKAVSLLDKTRQDSVNYIIDCNKNAEKEEKSILITYHLKFNDYDFYKKKFSEKGLPEELSKIIKITEIQRKVEVKKDNTKSNFFHIWIKDNKDFSKYVIQANTIKKISEVYNGEEKITTDNVQQLIGANYEICDKDSIEKFLENTLENIFEANIPKIIFWEYNDEYLINKAIDLNQFKANQDISIPLRNIFNIAEINKIQERIDMISKSKEKRKQLEDELSKKITSYINKIWPEHKINIKVDIENLQCEIMVEDKDDTDPKYNMRQRSDGFKQFVSILLNISAENSSEKLKNKLVILDEPEVHLHPSGIRYLRDELLNIAKNNIVLIATHSIYMVDKKDLTRHFKVDKKKSLTEIFQIPKKNPYMEEVVYEALGTSIYEQIEPNMIVFEGKTDKDLFDAFVKKYKSNLKPQKIGSISADGVDKIPTYTKFFNGKLVKGFIVVDSDDKGTKMKEKVLAEKNFTKKNTFEINDIFNTKIESTLEDLIPLDIIKNIVQKECDISIELDSTKPIIKQLEKKNKELKGKIIIEDIKTKITHFVLKDISKLKKEDCKTKYKKYYDFAETLVKKIKQ